MLHKCCAVFNGQPCRTNNHTTKTHSFECGTVVSLPKDLDKQKRWEMKDKEGRLSRNVGVCYKHFPLNCPAKILPGGTKLPTEPPWHLVVNRHPYLARPHQNSYVNQKTKYQIRSLCKMGGLKSVVEDTVDTFYTIVWCCNKFTPANCVGNSVPGTMKILKFKERFPTDREYSLLIHDSFQVNASCGHTKVATLDLTNGFTSTHIRFSQVEIILDRLENTPVNVLSEFSSCCDKVLGLVDEFDDEDEERRL